MQSLKVDSKQNRNLSKRKISIGDRENKSPSSHQPIDIDSNRNFKLHAKVRDVLQPTKSDINLPVQKNVVGKNLNEKNHVRLLAQNDKTEMVNCQKAGLKQDYDSINLFDKIRTSRNPSVVNLQKTDTVKSQLSTEKLKQSQQKRVNSREIKTGDRIISKKVINEQIDRSGQLKNGLQGVSVHTECCRCQCHCVHQCVCKLNGQKNTNQCCKPDPQQRTTTSLMKQESVKSFTSHFNLPKTKHTVTQQANQHINQSVNKQELSEKSDSKKQIEVMQPKPKKSLSPNRLNLFLEQQKQYAIKRQQNISKLQDKQEQKLKKPRFFGSHTQKKETVFDRQQKSSSTLKRKSSASPTPSNYSIGKSSNNSRNNSQNSTYKCNSAQSSNNLHKDAQERQNRLQNLRLIHNKAFETQNFHISKQNEQLIANKLSKEINLFALLELASANQNPEDISEDTQISFIQTKNLMHLMGYLQTKTLSQQSKSVEQELLHQMWLVLLQANNSQTITTLGCLKRFLFVVEGLNAKKPQSEIQRLFQQFRPFQINRISRKQLNKKVTSPIRSRNNSLTQKTHGQMQKTLQKDIVQKDEAEKSKPFVQKKILPMCNNRYAEINNSLCLDKLLCEKDGVLSPILNQEFHENSLYKQSERYCQTADEKYLNQSEKIEMIQELQQSKPSEEGLKKASQTEPLLFLDVNMGQSITERVVVYEGDTPELVAYIFCQKHGLDKKAQQKMSKLIHDQLQGILTKIVETDDLDQSSLL